MATCGAILLVPSQRVRCTLPHNHDGLHSFELDMGKRSRKASLPYQDDGEADNSDDSDVPKKKVKKAKKATSGGGASTSSSGVTWAPSRSATWQITVPKKIKIPAHFPNTLLMAINILAKFLLKETTRLYATKMMVTI